MTKFLPGQKVKLIEKITEGSYTYEVRHECAVIFNRKITYINQRI